MEMICSLCDETVFFYFTVSHKGSISARSPVFSYVLCIRMRDLNLIGFRIPFCCLLCLRVT